MNIKCDFMCACLTRQKLEKDDALYLLGLYKALPIMSAGKESAAESVRTHNRIASGLYTFPGKRDELVRGKSSRTAQDDACGLCQAGHKHRLVQSGNFLLSRDHPSPRTMCQAELCGLGRVQATLRQM
jgi:hypothetical protein